MVENNSDKKMWWGIVFGLLFIAAAGVAWFISESTVDILALFILALIGIQIVVVSVVKVRVDTRYFMAMTVLGVVMVAAGTLGGCSPVPFPKSGR